MRPLLTIKKRVYVRGELQDPDEKASGPTTAEKTRIPNSEHEGQQ